MSTKDVVQSHIEVLMQQYLGTAHFVCVDSVECDDFVVDVDWSPELGEMAMKKRERTP